MTEDAALLRTQRDCVAKTLERVGGELEAAKERIAKLEAVAVAARAYRGALQELRICSVSDEDVLAVRDVARAAEKALNAALEALEASDG